MKESRLFKLLYKKSSLAVTGLEEKYSSHQLEELRHVNLHRFDKARCFIDSSYMSAKWFHVCTSIVYVIILLSMMIDYDKN